MPKYTNDQEYRPRVQSGMAKAAADFSDKLPSMIAEYKGRQDDEKYTATILDPNSSPMQQALAWTKLKNPAAAAEVVKRQTLAQKGEMTKQVLSNAQQRIAENRGQASPENKAAPQNENVSATPSLTELNQELGQRYPNSLMSPINSIINSQMGQTPQQNFAHPATPTQPEAQQRNPIEIKRTEADILDQTANELDAIDPKAAAGKRHDANQIRKDVNTDIMAASKVESANIKAGEDREKRREKYVIPIQKYSNEMIKSTENTLHSLDDQLKVVKADKVGTFSGANISKYLKEKGWSSAIYEKFQTPEGALFATAGKEIITATLKPAFGARPLGMEFEAVVDMLAKTGRSKEANEIVIEALKIPAKIDNQVAKKTMEFIKNNPNVSAIELQSAQYEFREQVTDSLKEDWDQKMSSMLKTGAPIEKQGFYGTEKKQEVKTAMKGIWG